MPVLTKLYENYAMAQQAAAEVNALHLSDVETSVFGGDALRSQYGGTSEGKAADHAATEGDASSTGTGAGLGALVGGGAGLLVGLGMLAIPGIGPLVAAGWLATAAVGAAGGAVAGGVLGAVVDPGIPEEAIPVYSEAFRRGGVAVSARFPEVARAQVEAALSRVSSASLTDLRSQYATDDWSAAETGAQRDARRRNNPTPPGLL